MHSPVLLLLPEGILKAFQDVLAAARLHGNTREIRSDRSGNLQLSPWSCEDPRTKPCPVHPSPSEGSRLFARLRLPSCSSLAGGPLRTFEYCFEVSALDQVRICSQLLSSDTGERGRPVAEAQRRGRDQEPQAHWNLGAVEELPRQRNHAVHQIGLDNLPANFALARLVGGHRPVRQHEPGDPVGGEIELAEEILVDLQQETLAFRIRRSRRSCSAGNGPPSSRATKIGFLPAR